jgi:hypothetical protein
LVLDIESADKLGAAVNMYVIGSVIAGISLKNITATLLSTHLLESITGDTCRQYEPPASHGRFLAA